MAMDDDPTVARQPPQAPPRGEATHAEALFVGGEGRLGRMQAAHPLAAQLTRFVEDMGRLGGHPDKDTIVRLTTMAQQHQQDLGQAIVTAIQSRVLSQGIPAEHRLPLCYLMDSILQNVRGPYIQLFGRYVVPMLCRTYEFGSARDRQCVQKLLRLWRQRGVFDGSVVDPIEAFVERVEKGQSSVGSAPLPPPPPPPPPSSSPSGGPAVGEKRRLPGPQDPRQKWQQQLQHQRGGPPAAGLRSRSRSPPHHHHHRGGGGGGPGSPRGGHRTPAPSPAAPPDPLKSIEFIVAVDREMKALLDTMVSELGPGQAPMTIDELARRNPTAAEQLKRAAEQAVVGRMLQQAQQAVAEAAAADPFHAAPTGKDLVNKGGEVAQRLQRMVAEAGPAPANPGLIKAAQETASQLQAMIGILTAPVVAPPAPPPMPPAAVPGAGAGAAPVPAAQLALQALAQQLAGALLQQPQRPAAPLGVPLPYGGAMQPQQPQQQQVQQQHQPYQQMVARLHSGEQCHADGLRFPSRQELSVHEAWLEKVREVAAATRSSSTFSSSKSKSKGGLVSRAWLSPAHDWPREKRPYLRVVAFAAKVSKAKASGGMEGSGDGDGEDGELAHCVPVDDAQTACKLCGERFMQFWDARSSQWLYRNTAEAFIIDGKLARHEGGLSPPSNVKSVLVHWPCYEAADKAEAAAMLLKRHDSEGK